MADKYWGHELEWWKTVLSLLQLLVVGVGIALFNLFLGWHDKRQSDNAQLATLQNQLADESLEKYKAGLQGLLLRGDSGIEIIQRYVVNSENTCLDWQKAHFIVASLGAKNFYSRETIKLLLASWACHPEALGRDVEFLHVLQGGNNAARYRPCDLLDLSVINPLPLLQEAALLSAVGLSCPKKLELSANLLTDFKRRIPASSSAGLVEFRSFTDFPTSEKFSADSTSLGDLGLAIGNTFSNEQNGLDALWQQLRFRPLVERIAFGRFVLLDSTPQDAKILKKRKEAMESWMAEGLKSDDRSVRYAAVAALATFKWKGYLEILQKVASKDSDVYIRQIAALAMQPVQTNFNIK